MKQDPQKENKTTPPQKQRSPKMVMSNFMEEKY